MRLKGRFFRNTVCPGKKLTHKKMQTSLSHFSGQKVILGVTFRATLGETPKVAS